MAAKKANDFKGIDILEVFDWRLSIGNPILFNAGEFWEVKIMANDAPDGESIELDHHVTDVPGTTDPYDQKGITACYAWLHSVRDSYSCDNLELRKPIAAMINSANREANTINMLALDAQEEDDEALFFEMKGRLDAHITTANREIKQATKDYHAALQARGES